MKKCPFCAEEIQDEAIKCKHCNSNLTGAPAAGGGAGAAAAAPVLASAMGGASKTPHPDDEKTILYEGTPSWRAYFAHYFFTVVGTIGVAYATFFLFHHYGASGLKQYLSFLVPVGVGAVVFFAIGMVRGSQRVRVTSRSVETEEGFFAKKIDVLELWRIRDLRYKQGILDRILGIAHVEIFTKDVTSPHLEIVGMPASRQFFEKLRDSIEIQRQSQRVMGIMD